MDKIPYVLETIYSSSMMEVTRTKTIGGWLVNTIVNAPHGNAMCNTNFVHDPEWKWEVGNEASQ